ncbi:alpha/beta hydrolase [Mycolicibacterium palauense]|uniref:alpha/beta hydrolase n=1 Tax=Mycolicibacterium palauense TaxID=2034511 RepID=UPI001FE441D1|nr:alpha/beta hydrolase [Mycolicibacterium palauense]
MPAGSDRRWRTLLRAAAELVNAVNGVRPLGRQGYLSMPVFAFGWPTSELSPLVFAVSAADAARRGWRGDFRGTAGRAALCVHGAQWALLGLIAWQNLHSGPHLEAGLRDALGPDYRSVADTRRFRRRAGVFRTGWSRRRYMRRADTVRYGPHGRANLADIWRRRDLPDDAKAPVVVQVPGGAWSIGMRRPQAYPLMSRLAEQGWVCVSIAYRVSPRHTWPDHIVDVKRALSWVRDHIAEYGGDPDFVAITGGSAGGHLAALAALTPNDPRFQPGFEDADTTVAAAVPVYGRYDWFSTAGDGRREFVAFLQRFVTKLPFARHRQTYVEASPIAWVGPGAPPFFVLHGRDDSLIPVAEGRAFAEALRSASDDVVAYSEVPHAQHAFDFFGSPRGHHTAEVIERFLSWVHARHP